MEDCSDPDSEVSARPLPEEKTREPQGRADWPEDDEEEEEQLEIQVDVVVAQRPKEVGLDETIYADKMSVKELQLACRERQLPLQRQQEEIAG